MAYANICRKYYGTKMMLILLATFYASMVAAGYIVELLFGTVVLMVPLAPDRGGSPPRCCPIGCYQAFKHLAEQYRRDR